MTGGFADEKDYDAYIEESVLPAVVQLAVAVRTELPSCCYATPSKPPWCCALTPVPPLPPTPAVFPCRRSGARRSGVN
jgi:hypothetical protein